MDERKKTLAGLENKKRETKHLMDLVLEDFGQKLFSRLEEGNFSEKEFIHADFEEYRRITAKITGFDEEIRRIQAAALRLEELEAEIRAGEKDAANEQKNLSALYIDLGTAVLETDYPEAAAPFAEQRELLVSTIDSLAAAQEELEESGSSNVFAWIGKGARAVMNRSSLSKNKKALEKLLEKAGETLSQSASAIAADGAVTDLAARIGQSRELLRVVSEKNAALREERRAIRAGAAGGAAKNERSTEKKRGRAEEERRVLCLKFGGRACDPAHKKRFAFLLNEEDAGVLEKAGELRKELRNHDKKIEKIRASIAIDEERALIDTIKHAIAEQRGKIARAEAAAAELEEKLKTSERRVAELEKI